MTMHRDIPDKASQQLPMPVDLYGRADWPKKNQPQTRWR